MLALQVGLLHVTGRADVLDLAPVLLAKALRASLLLVDGAKPACGLHGMQQLSTLMRLGWVFWGNKTRGGA